MREILYDEFPQTARRMLGRVIRREERIRANLDALASIDRRRRINLADLFGCVGERDRIRTRMTVAFTDQTTGQRINYDMTVEIGAQGRLSSLLREAAQRVLIHARGNGYDAPGSEELDVSDMSIEYIECI